VDGARLEAALRPHQLRAQAGILGLAGKARREGDLASSRRGRKAAAVAGPARGAG
jgi:hypothetical protein